MAAGELELKSRRRVPRRIFETVVGMLLHGQYSMQRTFQVGEGGMMVSAPCDLKMSEQIVVSFYLPSCGLVVVRGVVRSVIPESGEVAERYGIEFENLGFQHKREIRNFVASTDRGEGLAKV